MTWAMISCVDGVDDDVDEDEDDDDEEEEEEEEEEDDDEEDVAAVEADVATNESTALTDVLNIDDL